MTMEYAPAVAQDVVGEALQAIGAERDELAWERLLASCGRPMYRVAYGVLGDHQLAEDAVQQALLAIRDSAASFHSAGREEAARAWVYRVTAHCAMNLGRHHHAQIRRERRCADAQDSVVKDDDALAERDTRQYVRQAVEALPEQHRQPLLLHYYGDMGYEEIAAALSCTVTTARVKVHRAIKRLRRQLAGAGLLLSLSAINDYLQAAVPSEQQIGQVVVEQLPRWRELLHAAEAGPAVLPVETCGVGFGVFVAGLLLSAAAAVAGWQLRPAGDQPTLLANSFVPTGSPAVDFDWQQLALDWQGVARDASEDLLRAPVSARWRFGQAHDDLVALFGADAGRSIINAAVADQPVRGGLLCADALPAGVALDLLCAHHGLSWWFMNDPIRQRPAIYVGLADQAVAYGLRVPDSPRPWSQRPARIEPLLERAVDLRGATTAAEALALAQRQTGLAIACFDPMVFRTPVPAANTVAELLTRVAAANGLQLQSLHGVAVISRPAP